MSDAALPLSIADLRTALLARRHDLLAALRRDGLEAAYLAQFAGTAAALAALDEEAERG